MSGKFDPYYEWLGIAPKHQPPNHYRLLGIDLWEDNAEVISNAADRQMGHLRTYQTGKHSAVTQKLLNEISAARVCLLDKKKKKAYDEALRAQVAADPAQPATIPAESAPPAGSTEPADDEAIFSEYRFLETLDSNDTGTLYKAKHRSMGRIVALKVLTAAASKSGRTADRFRRKAQMLARLDHPNIVAAFDAGERQGRKFLIMEFIDGHALTVESRQSGPLPVSRVVDFVRQAAAGLGHMHLRGFVHRNVKPSNLMLDKHDCVKLIGLGVAMLLPSAADETSISVDLSEAKRVVGTVDYMAPEQATNSLLVSPQADIYGLGCTLHVLLTGRPPYPGRTPAAKAKSHREAPIPSLRRQRRDAPAELDAVFAHMLAKNPLDRPGSMDEVIASLMPF